MPEMKKEVRTLSVTSIFLIFAETKQQKIIQENAIQFLTFRAAWFIKL